MILIRFPKKAFGNTAGKYYLFQNNWPFNPNSKEVAYHLFHHLEDAFTVVYTDEPQYLSVSHESVLASGDTVFYSYRKYCIFIVWKRITLLKSENCCSSGEEQRRRLKNLRKCCGGDHGKFFYIIFFSGKILIVWYFSLLNW